MEEEYREGDQYDQEYDEEPAAAATYQEEEEQPAADAAYDDQSPEDAASPDAASPEDEDDAAANAANQEEESKEIREIQILETAEDIQMRRSQVLNR
jgi:hypothetical protein